MSALQPPPPPPPPPVGTGVLSEASASRQYNSGKVALLSVWTVLWGACLLVFAYFNLWTFHGIDFPDDSSIAGFYAFAGWSTVYGGSFLAWVLAFVFVRRNVGWVWLILLLAVPIVVQVGWFVAFTVLGERYGYII